MDDVYFWVLRLWHILTSNKKVLVVLIGVGAVVATVTTVIAAPAETGSLASIQDAPGGSPVVESEVVPSADVVTIGNVTGPGILPTSPFYPLKVLKREVTLLFTFDPVGKANCRLRYASEDLLAVSELYGVSASVASEHCTDYEDDFWDSILWAAKAREEGHDVQGIMNNLRVAHDTQRLILADMLNSASNEDEGGVVSGGVYNVRDAVIEAAASTSAELEYAILAMQGQGEANNFHVKLQSDFSSDDRELWLQIENRLGMPAEQAMALTAAIGQETTVTGMPIITSMRVDSFRVEPGESCPITCMATDMQGDSLSYQWIATHGDFQGDGSSVTWTAPDDAGEYRVTVVVSDTKGNQSSKAVTFVVGNPPDEEQTKPSGGAFWIDSMDVVPVGHHLLKPPVLGTKQWTILQGRPVDITCVVDGATDGLKYDWSCDVGNLDGRGETVSWEAPDHACYANVTVKVSGGGDSKEETVTFRVSTCGSCFS